MWGAQRAVVCSRGSELYIFPSGRLKASRQVTSLHTTKPLFYWPSSVLMPCSPSAIKTISCLQFLFQEGDLLRKSLLHSVSWRLLSFSLNAFILVQRIVSEHHWAFKHFKLSNNKQINWIREWVREGQHRNEIYFLSAQVGNSCWVMTLSKYDIWLCFSFLSMIV